MRILAEHLGVQGWLGIAIVSGCIVMIIYFAWYYLYKHLNDNNNAGALNKNNKVNGKEK
jgi:hypothetical protein